MKIEFRTTKLKKQLNDPAKLKKEYGKLAKSISQRLDEITSAPNLGILMQLPRPRCHPLKGDKKGEWAVDLIGKDRMIFAISQSPIPENEDGSIDLFKVFTICILGIGDYH